MTGMVIAFRPFARAARLAAITCWLMTAEIEPIEELEARYMESRMRSLKRHRDSLRRIAARRFLAAIVVFLVTLYLLALVVSPAP